MKCKNVGDAKQAHVQQSDAGPAGRYAKTLLELNRSMKGFQPGSPAYNKMVADMQRLDQVLRELQPVLRTLNEKSNALVFEASGSQDPQPKRAK